MTATLLIAIGQISLSTVMPRPTAGIHSYSHLEKSELLVALGVFLLFDIYFGSLFKGSRSLGRSSIVSTTGSFFFSFFFFSKRNMVFLLA